jgi:hypothetical protein
VVVDFAHLLWIIKTVGDHKGRRPEVLFRVLDALAFGRSRMGLCVTLGYELAIL